jgi:hypothetical protein
MDSLSFKPDWPRARERLTAFWERSAVDRPCIAVKAPQAARRSPPPEPDALQALWLDPDYLAARWLWQLESTYFGGEAAPTGDILLAGYATGCGPGVRFAPNTIWHPQTMASMDAPLGWHPGPQDPWRPKLAAVFERLLDLAAGRFLVGYAIQVPGNDLLPLLRGSEAFLLDMAVDLDKCRAHLVPPGWPRRHRPPAAAVLASLSLRHPVRPRRWPAPKRAGLYGPVLPTLLANTDMGRQSWQKTCPRNT